jgi:hypothetical protein
MSSANSRMPGGEASTTGTSTDGRRNIDIITIEPVLVDVTTACKLLGGISPRKLDDLVLDGHITPKRIGSRVLFTPEELRRFATACPDWQPKH